MGRNAIEEAEIDSLLTDVYRMTRVRIDRNDPLIAVALLQNRFYRKQKTEIDNAITALKSENKDNHDKLGLILSRVSKLPRIFRGDMQKTFLKLNTVLNEQVDASQIITPEFQDDENDNINKHRKQLIFALIIGISIGFAIGRFLIKYI